MIALSIKDGLGHREIEKFPMGRILTIVDSTAACTTELNDCGSLFNVTEIKHRRFLCYIGIS